MNATPNTSINATRSTSVNSVCKTSKKSVPNTSIILSARVLNTINSLPVEDRVAVASAIAGELILGADASRELTPIQNLIFSMIRKYVEHDTDRYTQQMAI